MSDINAIDFNSYLARGSDGSHRLDRRVFTDPEIFELEMRVIWESNWVYLCHESQVAKPHDFMTGYIGRQPVLITRDANAELRCFANTCIHRGTQLENRASGNRKVFACPFHGWCYKSTGELVHFGNDERAGYPDGFAEKKMGLTPIARVESYRGFVFGSLSGDVQPLDHHLGEARKLLDMLCDQSEEGLEVLPGIQTYTFNGNWKLQAENGVDGYHVQTVHSSYVNTVMRRKRENADGVDPVDVARIGKLPGGYYDLGNGHTLLWSEWANPEVRPIYEKRALLAKKYGDMRADWIVGFLRNLLLYPNVFIMDQTSSQIRHFRPISVDKTEVTTYCIAPIGESAQAREIRIRQYEDFFNASGMATPDDLAAFNQSQIGFKAELTRWSDMSRGFKNQVVGAEPYAQQLGIEPVSSGTQAEDEGIMIAQHQRWIDLMSAAQTS